MEVVYNIQPVQWGHEKVKGQRMASPGPDDLVPVLGDDGQVVTDEEGVPQMRVPAGWQPQVEEIDLDTVVVVDRDQSSVTKIILGEALPSFLAHYIQFLDAEGRQHIRNALEHASGIVIPEVVRPKMALIKGGKK